GRPGPPGHGGGRPAVEQRSKTDAGRDTGRPGPPEPGATDRSSLRGAVAVGLSRADQEASSDAKNNTSTGSPGRRSGVRAILSARSPALVAFNIGGSLDGR